MIRVVLTVVLAAVVLAGVLPAADAARADRTATDLGAEVDRLVRTAGSLVTDEDATGPEMPGARRVVTVEIPERSWSAAGVEYVAIGGIPGSDASEASETARDDFGSLVYRIAGREPTVVRSDVAVRGVGGPLVLREPGRHRLVLSLVRDDGLVVVVTRA